MSENTYIRDTVAKETQLVLDRYVDDQEYIEVIRPNMQVTQVPAWIVNGDRYETGSVSEEQFVEDAQSELEKRESFFKRLRDILSEDERQKLPESLSK